VREGRMKKYHISKAAIDYQTEVSFEVKRGRQFTRIVRVRVSDHPSPFH